MPEDDRTRWNGRHAARAGSDPGPPSPFVVECLAHLAVIGLPRPPTALDVACGRGRHALLLGASGIDVTAVDVSDVAVEELRAAASRRSLPVTAVRRDVLAEGLPGDTFGLVLVVRFFERSLLARIRAAVAPGGALIMETFLHGAGGEAAGKGGHVRDEWQLQPGDLAGVAHGWDVRILREEGGLGCLLAIRPGGLAPGAA